jgi:hypothetical protein
VERNRRIRVLISRVGIALAVGASALVALAVPASAHHPVLTAGEGCNPPWHLAVWTIGNSESAASQTMTIVSAVATMNGTTYNVVGYSPTVAPSGTTTGYTGLPNTTGTMTLTVTASWPKPAAQNQVRTVTLVVHPCSNPSTTTTTPTTTPATTTPPTTTPDTTTPPTTTPDTTTPPTTTPHTTTPPTTDVTNQTTVPPTTTPDTTTPPTTDVSNETVPPTTIGGGGGGGGGTTTTTSNEPPVTVGGSTAPPNSPSVDTPVQPQGTPTTDPTPPGSLPFTGGGTGWLLFGLLTLCSGLLLVFVPARRSTARDER